MEPMLKATTMMTSLKLMNHKVFTLFPIATVTDCRYSETHILLYILFELHCPVAGITF